MKSLQDLYAWALNFASTTDSNFKELLSKSGEENKQLRTELETARSTISSHSAETTKLKADLAARDAEIVDLKLKAQTAEQIGSHKAAQITAAQGQPPIPLSPEANPATPKGPELTGLARTTAALAKKQA